MTAWSQVGLQEEQQSCLLPLTQGLGAALGQRGLWGRRAGVRRALSLEHRAGLFCVG